MRKRLPPLKALMVALLCVTATAGFLVIDPQPAHALCVQPKEEGRWTNADPNTRSITRVTLRFVCQDQVLNGQPFPPGPPWYVHLWGRCHPTDCDWGEVGATQSGGTIHAFYDQGFARRDVWIHMSLFRPGQLWVAIHTDFADPSRPDYDSQDWFVRS
jgi:hypothetical protein